ncbi:hypothetical protein Acr_00g0062140 [Actinidia rufa]|uniref:Uncharacterized protein n=1 Tax=Actinidia rufa TaxID=165716 RepID=A0A7J0DNV2_9ERIC|nr:hypothetical protein Acr_00g0062140 [Actinidia rufa]
MEGDSMGTMPYGGGTAKVNSAWITGGVGDVISLGEVLTSVQSAGGEFPLINVNINEEMRRKEQQRQHEAYEDDDDELTMPLMGCSASSVTWQLLFPMAKISIGHMGSSSTSSGQHVIIPPPPFLCQRSITVTTTSNPVRPLPAPATSFANPTTRSDSFPSALVIIIPSSNITTTYPKNLHKQGQRHSRAGGGHCPR